MPAKTPKTRKTNKKGFTLIEMLVVVLILAVLAAIAFPQYQLAVEKARASEVLSTLGTIKNACERYFLSRASYPTDFSELDITVPSSKSWTYSISGDLSVHATKKDSSGGARLIIAFRFDRGSAPYTIICRSQESAEFGEKVCKALGATESVGAFPTQNWILKK